MTHPEEFNYNQSLADCKKKLNICSDSDENTDQIKALILSVFELYLKKEFGWKHTDDFKKVIKNL